MKPALTLTALLAEAAAFCAQARSIPELFGVTDGKAVGTFIEHRFKQQLQERYVLEVGRSASGIDLPGAGIETDIKVTSIRQPQSSCPFKAPRQKIFGLGYHLLVFVYDKRDDPRRPDLFPGFCIVHFYQKRTNR